MKQSQINVLSQEEIEIIHNHTLNLLETIGIRVDSIEAKKLLSENGAVVDEKNDYVKFPESMMKEQLKTVAEVFSQKEEKMIDEFQYHGFCRSHWSLNHNIGSKHR